MLHARDLPIPADVTLLTDPDEIVFKVSPPRVQEVEAVVAAAPETVPEVETAAESAES